MAENNYIPQTGAEATDRFVKDCGEYIVHFKKSNPNGESFVPDTYTETLAKGYKFDPERRALPCDIVHTHDLAIPMRDGVKLYAELYRPAGEEKVPAIIGWTPFGKGPTHGRSMDGNAGVGMPPVGYISGLETFEGVDPAWWVDHGYAVLNVDVRGATASEGNAEFFGNCQDSDDGYDAIEWIAAQEWCSGKVTMAGNSWLAIAQWYIAAKNPPHLACIAPWEGHANMYRDEYVRGGIPNIEWTRDYFTPGNTYQEDIRSMIREYPTYNAYWKTKTAPFEKVTVPVYAIASFTNWCHPNGTFDGFRHISSKEKWLRIHNKQEWRELYNYENCEDLCRFFDHYMKGADNGWEKTPTVRLSVLDPGGTDVQNRPEKEWPLARQRFEKLYLDASDDSLKKEPVSVEAKAVYSCDVEPKHLEDREKEFYAYDANKTNMATFTYRFDKDTEVTGYIHLHTWVEAENADDMDLFFRVLNLDKDGKVLFHRCYWSIYSGPDNRLRVSLRGLDKEKSTEHEPEMSFSKIEKLSPGEIVPIDIKFWPTSQLFHAGEKLQLVIAGWDFMGWPPMSNLDEDRIKIWNKGSHIVHTGGKYDSYIELPVID